jgi:hypothetical protein
MSFTYYPHGVNAGDGLILEVQTAEPTESSYALAVGSGLTGMGLWAESDGLHWSYNGTEYSITQSYSGGGGGSAVGDLDGVYSNGRTVTLDEGAISLTDATTGALNSLEFTLTGAKSGNVIDVGVNAAITGNVIDIDMNLGIASGAIYIDNGATARTGADLKVKDDSTGAHSVIDIDSSGSGASVGLDWTDSYNGSDGSYGVKLTLDANDGIDATAFYVTRGAGIRTAPALDITDGSTGSADLIDIDLTGVFTGDVIDIATAAAATGNAIFINLDNGVAMTALHVEGSGIRTEPMIEIATDCTGAAAVIAVDVTGAISGNILAIGVDTTVTGNAIDIDMNAGVGAKALYIDAGNATRTAALVDLKHDGDGNVSAINIDHTNTGSGNIIEIDIDAVHTGDAININYGTGAATGDAIDITTGTNLAGNALKVTTAGARTAPVINIVGGGTDAGTDDHIILITQSAVLNSNMIQLTYDTEASDGDAIGITMGTNVAGAALAISGTGSRVDDLIKIDDGSTGSGDIFDINLSGIYTGNVLDITYSVAAATGNAIDLNMGTNVAGMALSINSAATGTNDEGAAIDIVHSGNLVEGATVLRIDSTGSPAAATGNIVELIQRTGAGTSGNYLLYMSATGTNVEALKVDDGAVVFDETLTVTGACTFSSTVTYKHKTEVVTAANVINASESGSVYFLKANDEFASTLPAPAAGLHFTFIVSQAPADVNYTITTTDSANIIIGMVNASTGGDEDSETSGCDTINFVAGTSTVGDKVEVFCDGTNWFAYGICDATGAITLTTAG